MPLIEGTTGVKTLVAEYDFAVDGGTVGSKTLRGIAGNGNSIPAGSTVVGGYLEVLTAFTSASTNTGTVALTLEGAGDLVVGTAQPVSGAPLSTTGRKDILPDSTGDTSVRTTVARSVVATVAIAAITAGKLRVHLRYV